MRPIRVEIRPGVFVPHSVAQLALLWMGVDRQATAAMVKPIEEDEDDEVSEP